jgi:hypothetical protein
VTHTLILASSRDTMVGISGTMLWRRATPRVRGAWVRVEIMGWIITEYRDRNRRHRGRNRRIISVGHYHEIMGAVTRHEAAERTCTIIATLLRQRG